MKLKISLLGLLCFFFQAFSQPQGTSKILKPGDKVPDILISSVLNYKAREIRLSDFKDKLLILDFWATYCTPCIHLLPKYDSLQNELGDKLQFLLVSPEKAGKVAAFLKNNSYSLPSVTDDVLLSALFPHNSIPHEVWINKGVVAAITYAEEVSRDKIMCILSGRADGIEQKQDNFAFDSLEPLLANGNGRGDVLFQSVITPFLPGLPSETGFRATPLKTVSAAINQSAVALYHQAFAHLNPDFAQESRFIYEIPDTLKAKIDRGSRSTFHEWIKKYGFCYSLTLPAGCTGEIADLMVADLNHFFGTWHQIAATIEKRTLNCRVLTRLPGRQNIASSGGTPAFAESEKNLVLKNQPIAKLVTELAYRYRKQTAPVVDESGCQSNVDLTINGDLGDPFVLNRELAKYGLRLTPLKRTIDMVVFKMVTVNQQNLPLNLNSN